MANILKSSSNLDLEQVERSLPPKARTSRQNGHARVYLESGATDLTREVDLGEGPSSRKAPKPSISTQIDASNTHIERSPIAAVGIETSGTTAKSGTTSGFLHQQLSKNNVSRSKVFRSSRRVADWVHNASKAASSNNDKQEDIEGLLNQLISSLQASSAKMDELEQTSGSQLERWVELENGINVECRNSVRSIHALALKSDEHPVSGGAPRSSLKRPYSRTSSRSDEDDDDEDRPSGSGRGASNKRPCLATIYVRPSFPHSPGQQPTNSTPPPAPSPPHTPRPRETANPLTSTSPRTPPPSHDHRTPAFVTSFLDTILQSPQHPNPPPATSPPQALPAAPHSPSYTPPSPSRLRSPVPVPSPSTPILNRRHRPLSPPPSIPTPPIVDHRYRPASPYHDYSQLSQHRDDFDYPRSPSRLSPRYTPEYERDPVVDENHYGRYSESHNPDHRDDEQRYRSRSRSPRRQTPETYPSTYPPRHDSPPTHPHPSTYHSSRGYSPLHLVYPPSHSSPRRESPQRLTPAPAQEERRETQTSYKRSPSPHHHYHSYRNRTSEWVDSQGQYRDPSRDPPHTEHSESYPDTETRERDSRLSTRDDRHRSFDSAHHRRSSSRSQLRADDASYSYPTHSQDRDYDYRRSENWTQPPNDHTQPYPTHSHDRYYDHPDHTWHSNLPPLRRRYDDAVYQDENERAYPNTMDRRYDDAPSHHSNSYGCGRHGEAGPSRPSRESHYSQWDERDRREGAYKDTRAPRTRLDYPQDARSQSYEAHAPHQSAPQSYYDYPRSTYRAPEQRHQEPSSLPSHQRHGDYDYLRTLWPEQQASSSSHHRDYDYPRSLYPDPEQRTSSSSHREHRDYPTRDRDTSHYRDEGRSWHWEYTRSRDADAGDRDTSSGYQRYVDPSDSISQNRHREPRHDRDDLEGRSYRERERELERDTRAIYRTTPCPYSRSRSRPETASESASVIHAPRPRRKIKIEAMQLLALEAEANEEAFDEDEDEDEDEDGANAAEDGANEDENGVNEAESTEETVVHAEANEKEEEEEEGSESGSEYSLRVYE